MSSFYERAPAVCYKILTYICCSGSNLCNALISGGLDVLCCTNPGLRAMTKHKLHLSLTVVSPLIHALFLLLNLGLH